MNYYKQVLTVTLWEYRRFFKLKNELLGIVIMLAVFSLSFFGGRYAVKESSVKTSVTVIEDLDPELKGLLSISFSLKAIPLKEKDKCLEQIALTKEGVLLTQVGNNFIIHSWKKPAKLKSLHQTLNTFSQQQAMQRINLTPEDYKSVVSPANVEEQYLYQSGTKGKSVLAFFFAGLMILGVFLSFAYQFTAITGEKQLKITEQIISAIKPQVWMDGKILGITLTGLSSMLTYSILGSLGGILFFQFTGEPIANILNYLHLQSILLFFAFTILGIMIWNAFMAAIASVITDPNNSGKSPIMLLPVLFVIASFLVMLDPDNGVSIFLSWFPLTSATAMPMRSVETEVEWWQLAGSFAVLGFTFYLLRILAAKIFHVSILISGKEPSWKEVIKLVKQSS